MNRVASKSHPLTAFERLRHWWHRLATSAFPAAGATGADRTAAQLIEQFEPLLGEIRAHRGGEITARARAGRIAALYRDADLPQRAALLNLITHEFAPDRAALERQSRRCGMLQTTPN